MTFQAIRDFVYGLYAYEFERQALEMRGETESAFMLITLGDMLGGGIKSVDRLSKAASEKQSNSDPDPDAKQSQKSGATVHGFKVGMEFLQ